MNFLLSGILALSTFGGAAPSESGPIATFEKLHPYLVEQMLLAPADRVVPVYFVMGDRLGFDHWFPRVNLLSVEERRTLVMKEAQEHAERTQAPVLAALEEAVAAGQAEGVTPNWLGNFVLCRALPEQVLKIAALAAVSEVWFDHIPPLAEVEDGAAVPGSGSAPAPFMPAGNGPLDTHADQVWALGINGAGVVVMNTDSGINVNHSDLAGRLWINPGELAGNGIDDDGNGFIDDINGWDFGANGTNLSDGGGHGTNTAGCLVADGTCNGTIYGQAPGARVMTGKIVGETHQWAGIQYAIAKGAHCQTSSHSYKNNSSPVPNYRMHRDVGETSLAAGLIRTNSTSNNGASCTSTTSVNRRPFNISAPGCLPAPYTDPNQTLVGRKGGVVGVAAHSVNTSTLASYSPCGPFAWYLPDLQAVLPSYNVANWDTANDNDYPYTAGSQQGLLKPDVSAPTGTTTPSGSGTCGTTTFSGTSNATPVANGVLVLWKSANPSLKPEDAAMIAHQSAAPTGSLPGKENNFGAGKIDARAGLELALCVHRVNGEPAWTINHQVGTTITVEVDTLPNAPVILGVGISRTATWTGGGIIGIDPPMPYFSGVADAAGNLSHAFPAPVSWVGGTLFTQAFSGDSVITGSPASMRLLSSNVIGVTFVP